MVKFEFIFSDGQKVEIPTSAIDQLRKHYASEDLRRRMSTSLWIEMYALHMRYDIYFLQMLQPIFDLENNTSLSRTKKETPFRRAPLKGLWHKHFFSARFLAANVVAGHGSNGLKNLIAEVWGPPDSFAIFTEEKVAELAKRVVHDPLNKRFATGTATGEYIIYLPRPDGNYYLTIGLHGVPDQVSFDGILQNCTPEFPDLANWIDEAKSAQS